MEPFKLAITGAFNTGKTTFVRSLSEIDVVDTDRATTSPAEQRVKSTTTVAMDYGRINIDQWVVRLFGTPGQARFDFMREILTKGVDGVLVLVDASDPATIDTAASIIAQFRGEPFALGVVMNKSDLKAEVSADVLRQQLELPDRVKIYTSVATDRESVRQVVRQFLIDSGR